MCTGKYIYPLCDLCSTKVFPGKRDIGNFWHKVIYALYFLHPVNKNKLMTSDKLFVTLNGKNVIPSLLHQKLAFHLFDFQHKTAKSN